MTCKHPVKLKAVNITAVIERGYLRGGPAVPLAYDEIQFCANPLCEQVFKAEKVK
jgi:hypothetical protein